MDLFHGVTISLQAPGCQPRRLLQRQRQCWLADPRPSRPTVTATLSQTMQASSYTVVRHLGPPAARARAGCASWERAQGRARPGTAERSPGLRARSNKVCSAGVNQNSSPAGPVAHQFWGRPPAPLGQVKTTPGGEALNSKETSSRPSAVARLAGRGAGHHNSRARGRGLSVDNV